MAKRPKRKELAADIAVARATEILPALEENIRTALGIEAAMEAANATLGGKSLDPDIGASTFESLHLSMVVALAITIARIFDITERWPVVDQDKCSLPVLVHVVRQQACQARLIKQARAWTPQLDGMADVHERSCRRALDQLVGGYVAMLRRCETRRALRRLRDFRNKRLAHSLRSEVRELPQFNDLFLLIDQARALVATAGTAIIGQDYGHDSYEEHYGERARAFWSAAGVGLLARAPLSEARRHNAS